MKPHRRKKTSPRRVQEGAAPADPANAAVPVEPIPEEPQYEEPAGTYDPGQALAEEQQAYVDPNQAYVDPNAGYAEPVAAQEETVPPPPAIIPAAGVYDTSPEPSPAPRVTAPRAPAVVSKQPGVGPRVQGRRPVTTSGRGRPPYKRPAAYTPSGGGISMMTVFMTLVAIGMLAVVVMIVLPKEMSGVKGYPVSPIANSTPRNLLSETQQLIVDRGGEITFSEAEVNQYLNQRMEGLQGGPLAALVQFRGIYADFSKEQAEFLIEREILGFPVTMSSKITAESFRGSLSYRPVGWTLGKIDLSSRNVKPVIEMFLRMRSSFMDEYQVLQMMANVRFEDNKVTLTTSR